MGQSCCMGYKKLITNQILNMGKTIIQLQSLHLRYFKSFKDFKVEFNENVASVKGDNGTGKTTLADAWSWLLFGKNSNDISDTKFSIKTIDEATGQIINRVDHSVEAIFFINGEKTTAKRELKEKWVKKKGATEKVYSGNVTNYYWNEVPLSQRDYQVKINQFINEDVFKLIIDPYKFNSLHWEKQRETLTQLVGGVSDESIAKGNPQFEELMSKLENKTFDEYKKQMKHTLKRLKDDKQGIPSRIDEQLRDKPRTKDFDAIESEIQANKKQLQKVDDKIADVNKTADDLHKKYSQLREKQSDLKSRNQDITFKIQGEVQQELSKAVNPSDAVKQKIENNLEDIEKFQRAISRFEKELETDKASLETVIAKREAKSKEWDLENASELKFEEGDFVCPSCKRPLESEDEESEKEKMRADFIKDKQNALSAINREGSALKTQQENLEISIDETEKRIGKGKKELKSRKDIKSKLESELQKISKEDNATESKEDKVNNILLNHEEYQANLKEIDRLNKALSNQEGVDVSDLKKEREQYLEEIDTLKTLLNDKAKIEQINNRIAELEKEERENSQLIADAEKELYTIQEFEVARMTKTEESINSRFKEVEFKMFSELVDGTQVPACICLYKGVPFPDVNTAGKIKAGLDIINTLCDHFGVNAPIFIDSAESITDIPETTSQQIRLIVEKGTNPFIVE